jgi:hypothetical protein
MKHGDIHLPRHGQKLKDPVRKLAHGTKHAKHPTGHKSHSMKPSKPARPKKP